MSAFRYEKDSDGIVTITMDMTGPVNSMNQEYRSEMGSAVTKLESEEGLSGVVFASAKKVFFAGGDIKEILATKKGDGGAFYELVQLIKGQLRRLEKLPVPVVAAINGAALGGGFEICLACNHRIAADVKAVQVGLPEVTLGLLPGGGGIVKMVHLLGLEKALPFLLEGTKVNARKALEVGLVHEMVGSIEELVPRAKAWILENKANAAAAVQPWDTKGHSIPGGDANSPGVSQLIMAAIPMLAKKTWGLLPAPERILDVAVEAAKVDFDTAMIIESRGLAHLAITPEAKNLMTTFFQLNKVNGGASRPRGIDAQVTEKVGILGAGMMGQRVAYVSAMAGIEVVLKDTSMEAAEKGKGYSRKLLEKKVELGRMDRKQMDQILGLIKPTASDEDLKGCDLIIEAVFENMDLKKRITASTEQYLAENGVWGSNTSSLPITQLAEASSRPENFIGIHFFSPVDKMPLVEIICGEMTSDQTLAKAFDYTQKIRKTPIVVNDSLGFFTSRTFITYLDEGVNLLREGVNPVRIDNLGRAIGMPVGPLAMHDEVSLELLRKVQETHRQMGVLDKFTDGAIMRDVIGVMIGEYGRGGRYNGGGFYEYADDGSKKIWPRLYDLYYRQEVEIADKDIKDRLLFRQVIESLICLETNVLRSVADGNIGSLMGIGAPAWTGGFIQFVNTYGLDKFISRCDELAEQFGMRFKAPAIVSEKLTAGELFE